MPGISSTIFTPEIIRDPHPTLALLREEAPVFWDERIGSWLVTRYDDVKTVYADDRFSRDRRLGRHFVAPAPGSWAERFDQNGLGRTEGEEHRRWRARLAKGFTPRAVARMEDQVRAVVAELADPLRDRRGVVDLVDAFTNPIPNTVISRITGIPPYPGEEERFRRLAQDVIRRFLPMADEANVRRGENAIGELAEWVGKLAEERRQEPREDLVSDLIHGNPDDPMTNLDIVLLVALLIAAGSETTTLAGTHALRLLLRNPEQLAHLRRDPGLVRTAVREVLRFGFGSAGGGVPRYAMQDLEIRGQRIRQADMVMLSLAAANRDPEVFADPDRFDVTRDNRDMLAFGSGPHYCLGANLALQELTCMVEAALAFLPEDATLLEDRIEWEIVGLICRPVALPVRF
ncbi:MAG: cytochrome P450 [Spirochaetaceae bacterium]|nr:cytochrome P450 [Spirochaetaceae bacterium]